MLCIKSDTILIHVAKKLPKSSCQQAWHFSWVSQNFKLRISVISLQCCNNNFLNGAKFYGGNYGENGYSIKGPVANVQDTEANG